MENFLPTPLILHNLFPKKGLHFCVGLSCLGLIVRFPLPWLISLVRVYTSIQKLSCVNLYVVGPS